MPLHGLSISRLTNAVVTVEMAIGIITAPLAAIILHVLLKYRAYTGPFFTIYKVGLVYDILSLVSMPFTVLPTRGTILPDDFMESKFYLKTFYFVNYFTHTCQGVTNIALCLNRASAVLLPLFHNKVWKNRFFLPIFFVAQFCAGVYHALYCLEFDLYLMQYPTGERFPMPVDSPAQRVFWWNTFIPILGSSIFTVLLYCCVGVKLSVKVHHAPKTRMEAADNRNAFGLLCVAVVVAVLELSYLLFYCYTFVTHVDYEKDFRIFYAKFFGVTYLYSCVPSYILVIFCRPIRDEVVAIKMKFIDCTRIHPSAKIVSTDTALYVSETELVLGLFTSFLAESVHSYMPLDSRSISRLTNGVIAVEMVIGTITVPLTAIILYVLLKSRTYSGSFFILYKVGLAYDILSLLCMHIMVVLPTRGIILPDNLMESQFFLKAFYCVNYFTHTCQSFTNCAICLNRASAVLMPLFHRRVWTNRFLLPIFFIVQLCGGVYHATLCLKLDLYLMGYPTGERFPMVVDTPELHNFWFHTFIAILGCSILMVALYCRVGWTLSVKQAPKTRREAAESRLAFSLLCLSVVVAGLEIVYLIFYGHSFVTHIDFGKDFRIFFSLFFGVTYLYSCVPSYLLILFCKSIRDEVFEIARKLVVCNRTSISISDTQAVQNIQIRERSTQRNSA